jgi:hypothetical protein
MRKVICVLTALLAGGLIAAGCGDDDGGETLSKQEYIAQADANCNKADKELNSAPEPKGKNGLEKFATDTLVPNIQGQIDFVRDLNGPQEVEDQVNPILDTAQEGLDEIKADPSQLERGGPRPGLLSEFGRAAGWRPFLMLRGDVGP